MAVDSLGALESIIKAIVLEQRQHPVKATPSARVVTISTGAGAGGKEVARMLSERLSIPVFDKEILNAVAEEAHVEKHVLAGLDERVDGLKGAWLRYLVTGESLFKDTYRRNLINVVLAIASHGGVILGRGANFILSHLPVLRLRIIGTSERCVGRYVNQEGVQQRVAESLVAETDKGRREFIRALYQRDIDDPRGYDLSLNSDRLTLARIAEIAEFALSDFELDPEHSQDHSP
jgi:cytidylate kinase